MCFLYEDHIQFLLVRETCAECEIKNVLLSFILEDVFFPLSSETLKDDTSRTQSVSNFTAGWCFCSLAGIQAERAEKRGGGKTLRV